MTRLALAAVLCALALPAVAQADQLTAGRMHAVAPEPAPAVPVLPGTLNQARYLLPGYMLPGTVRVRPDAATACVGVGYYCVMRADGVIHVRPQRGGQPAALMAHEAGHVLDFAMWRTAPAVAQRFTVRWAALNGRAGADWTAGESPPFEQFAGSYAACATGMRLATAAHLAQDLSYGWVPRRATYDATCRLVRREVHRAWRLAA